MPLCCSRGLLRRSGRRDSEGGSFDPDSGLPAGAAHEMWVVSVKDFLQMEGSPLHHQELKRSGVLVRWDPGMLVTFVSHQWAHNFHPDPEGRQLDVLREFIRNLRKGAVEPRSDIESAMIFKTDIRLTSKAKACLLSGFIWYDYFSIPQCVGEHAECAETRAQQIQAILSIPSYCVQSEVFLVLCPALLHCSTGLELDYMSWRSRAWCRAEAVVRMLTTRKNVSILVVKSAVQAIYVMNGVNVIQCPVGEGCLTYEGDRPVLRKLVQKTLLARLNRDQECEQYSTLYFKCMEKQILRGLEDPEQDLRASRPVAPPGEIAFEEDQEEFLASIGARSWVDQGPHNRSPLSWAVLKDDLSLVRAAFANGATLEEDFTPMQPPKLSMGIRGGVHPLAVAAALGSPELVQLLMDKRADPNQYSQLPTGMPALGMTSGRPASDPRAAEVVTTLLEAKAEVNARSLTVKQTILTMACYGGNPAVLRALLSYRADVNAVDKFGQTPMHMLALFTGDVAAAKVLVQHGADVNQRMWPAGTAKAIGYFAWLGVMMGAKSVMIRTFADGEGATPLHYAASRGQMALSKYLLSVRADLNFKNIWGRTALDLAAAFGHQPLVELFQAYMAGEGLEPCFSI